MRHWRLAAILAAIALSGCMGVPTANPYPPIPEAPAELIPKPPPSGDTLVWQPGHYEWIGAGYVWYPGQYVTQDGHGTLWQPGSWQRTRSGWVWQPGHWL